MESKNERPVVLLLEKISAAAENTFRNAGFEIRRDLYLDEEQLIEALRGVDVVGIRSKTKMTERAIASSQLSAIGCFCIGTDQTDLKFAASRGIPVFNAPFANTRSVAEIVMANIVCLARTVMSDSFNMHNGIWQKSANGKHEVRGKVLGIIGYGHVGSQLSVLAESFGMKVLYYDIIPKLPLGNAQRANSMNEVLMCSDFVSLHVPATEETKNMITLEQIELMKSTASLINYARGQCCVVEDVAEALNNGRLWGAAFDVFPVEPGSSAEEFSSPLRGCKNTILTPHIGGSTEEAQCLIGEEVANKLVEFFRRGSTVSSVNFPEVNLKASKRTARVVNVHQNVPGVLSSINEVLSDYNISSQMVATDGSIGYFMCQLDTDIGEEVRERISDLPDSIKTRKLSFFDD